MTAVWWLYLVKELGVEGIWGRVLTNDALLIVI